MSLVPTILVLGLALGAILVWRLARRGGGDEGRELERADLQRPQEELYERLRAARAADEREEVAEPEHQAAINLRDLEALGDPSPPTAAPEPAPTPTHTTGPARAEVGRAPDDLPARKRYALALLATGQLFPAFQQAQEIVAVDLFDRLLAGHPEHIPALVAKGLARAREGDSETARELWLRALRSSGADNPQIERLLAALDAQGATAAVTGEPTPPATMAAEAVYTAIVRLAAGLEPPSTGVLFISLRGDAGGPPAAVRHVAAPSFPLEVTLSADDSMLGRPLPESGKLTARLDTDGNASTRQPEDLDAEVDVRQGPVIGRRLELPPLRPRVDRWIGKRRLTDTLEGSPWPGNSTRSSSARDRRAPRSRSVWRQPGCGSASSSERASAGRA